ncbi:hypothetical protein SLS63_007491 [Diaporthe eres]|uniref:Uncharacterized protein n=1 Tax=Diaporthe eres TaxID=83184 RepID=A0ABR1P5C0_DIAER
MAAYLKAKAPVDFSANMAIMKAYTAWIKSRTFYDKPEIVQYVNVYEQSEYEAPFTWMVTRFLSAASGIEDMQEHVSSQIQIEAFNHIDEFENSVIELEEEGQMTFEPCEDEHAEDNEYAAAGLSHTL